MIEVKEVNWMEAIAYILPVLNEAQIKNLQVTIDEKNWVVVIGIPKYIPVDKP